MQGRKIRIQMKKILHIRRQKAAGQKAYWEDFSYEGTEEAATVATALTGLPVAWEHSCLQKKCGACAMVINGVPRLACDTRLRDLRQEVVTLEPLRKFPVIEDLMVDRSAMMEKLKELEVWFTKEAAPDGEDEAFEASKCLQCGLCLEVCPNFYAGGQFGGMAAMAPMARLFSKLPEEQKRPVSQNYKKGVYQGCGKSLACRNICPAGIDMERLLVKSNAAAVWGRKAF